MAVFPVGMVYEEGDNVTFTCSSLGGPDNMIQWLKDGMVYGGVISASENNLTLTDITVAGDGGVYTCVVSNAAGSDMASVSLNIQPVFTVHPADQEIVSGDNVSFSCSAMAFPEPTYMWFREGGELPDSALGANSSMLVLDPAVFGDQGVYYCNATSSEVSVSSQPATLTSRSFSTAL